MAQHARLSKIAARDGSSATNVFGRERMRPEWMVKRSGSYGQALQACEEAFKDAELSLRVFQRRTFRAFAFPGELGKWVSREAKSSREGLGSSHSRLPPGSPTPDPLNSRISCACPSFLKRRYHTCDNKVTIQLICFEWSSRKLTGKPLLVARF